LSIKVELDERLRQKWSISVLEGTKRLGIAKRASDVMTQTKLRQTNHNGSRFS